MIGSSSLINAFPCAWWFDWGGAAKIRKELFIVDEEQKHVQFAKTFLVGWDNSLSNQQVRVRPDCVDGDR